MEERPAAADYKKPILMDNQGLRKRVSNIDRLFVEIEAEASRFPKVNGIIVDPLVVEDIKICPVCCSCDIGQLFVKWGFIYSKCHGCGHVFMRNRVREEALLKLYAEATSDKLDREVNESDFHKRYWSAVYDKYLSFLDRGGCPNKNLLDVGCGNGGFLRYCKDKTAYHPAGIDYAVDTYKDLLALLGAEDYYFQKDIEAHDFKGKKFGVITFWGVLEHLPRPVDVCRKCGDLLAPGGQMLIFVPNLFSRAFRILGLRVPTLNGRSHIQFFSHRSFEVLCERSGLELVEKFQELPVIDLMYDFIDYNEDLVKDVLREEEAYNYVYVVRKR